MLDVNDEHKRNPEHFLTFLLLLLAFIGIASALLVATDRLKPLTWWQIILVIGVITFVGFLWLPKNTWLHNGVLVLVSAVLGAFLLAFLYPILPPIFLYPSSTVASVADRPVDLTWCGVADGFLSGGLIGFFVRWVDPKAIHLDLQGVARYLAVFVLVAGVIYGGAIVREFVLDNRFLVSTLTFLILGGIGSGIRWWDRYRAQKAHLRDDAN